MPPRMTQSSKISNDFSSVNDWSEIPNFYSGVKIRLYTLFYGYYDAEICIRSKIFREKIFLSSSTFDLWIFLVKKCLSFKTYQQFLFKGQSQALQLILQMIRRCFEVSLQFFEFLPIFGAMDDSKFTRNPVYPNFLPI